jgi:hypothetical protein
MLVTFSSKAHADVTLFGDVAKKLLGIMGHSGTIPGAIRPEDIPPALEQLRLAVAEDPASDDGNAPDDDSDRNVSLSRRAWPLIELLSAAHRENCIVMWDRYG